MNICQICLRGDLKLKVIDNKLAKFHDEFSVYSVFCYFIPKYCPYCEHLLRKAYNFRAKCIMAAKILMKCKEPCDQLYAQLPQSSLGFWVQANTRVVHYEYSEEKQPILTTNENIIDPTSTEVIVYKPNPTDLLVQHDSPEDESEVSLSHVADVNTVLELDDPLMNEDKIKTDIIDPKSTEVNLYKPNPTDELVSHDSPENKSEVLLSHVADANTVLELDDPLINEDKIKTDIIDPTTTGVTIYKPNPTDELVSHDSPEDKNEDLLSHVADANTVLELDDPLINEDEIKTDIIDPTSTEVNLYKPNPTDALVSHDSPEDKSEVLLSHVADANTVLELDDPLINEDEIKTDIIDPTSTEDIIYKPNPTDELVSQNSPEDESEVLLSHVADANTVLELDDPLINEDEIKTEDLVKEEVETHTNSNKESIPDELVETQVKNEENSKEVNAESNLDKKNITRDFYDLLKKDAIALLGKVKKESLENIKNLHPVVLKKINQLLNTVIADDSIEKGNDDSDSDDVKLEDIVFFRKRKRREINQMPEKKIRLITCNVALQDHNYLCEEQFQMLLKRDIVESTNTTLSDAVVASDIDSESYKDRTKAMKIVQKDVLTTRPKRRRTLIFVPKEKC